MKRLLWISEILCIMLPQIHLILAGERDIEVNYDIGHYKLLNPPQPLEIICKNLRNRSPPSWTYPETLFNNPRMTISYDGAESRLVINETKAEDAGKYGCHIEHQYNGNTFKFDKEIEAIVNKISDVEVNKTKDGIKLKCILHSYPSPAVTWKIKYDNESLRPQVDEDEDYPDLHADKIVVYKSEGRYKLQPYNGVKNAELIITNCTENDNGTYFCVSTNAAGEECRNCSVRVPRAAAESGKSAKIKIESGNTPKLETRDTKNPEKEGISTETVTIITSVVTIATCFAVVFVILIRARKRIPKKVKGSMEDLHKLRIHKENKNTEEEFNTFHVKKYNILNA